MTLKFLPTTSSRRPVRVAIVNDYPIIVAGVHGLLGTHPERIAVVEVEVGRQVDGLVDVILVDTFAAAAQDGVDITSMVVRPDGAKVVLFGWGPAAPAARHAERLGAAAYLSKALSSADLVDAIESIHGGDVPPGTQRFAAEPIQRHAWPGQHHGLSAREAEVVGLIARGMSNQEIAAATFLGVNTVKTYIRTAYHKIGSTSRTQAVLWALDNGFAQDTA